MTDVAGALFQKLEEQQSEQPFLDVGWRGAFRAALVGTAESALRQGQRGLWTAAKRGGKPEHRLIIQLDEQVKAR